MDESQVCLQHVWVGNVLPSSLDSSAYKRPGPLIIYGLNDRKVLPDCTEGKNRPSTEEGRDKFVAVYDRRKSRDGFLV